MFFRYLFCFYISSLLECKVHEDKDSCVFCLLVVYSNQGLYKHKVSAQYFLNEIIAVTYVW